MKKKKRKVIVCVRISNELKKQLLKVAENQETTLTNVVTGILNLHLQNEKK